MTKTSITATEAKNRFAEMVDLARVEPVTITRNDRAVAIVLSPAEYSRLVVSDDMYWGEQANRVKKDDFITIEKSQELLDSILNAKN